MSHKSRCVAFSFQFISNFSNFHCDFFFGVIEGLKGVLFIFHGFVTFPVFLSLLISNFVVVREAIFGDISLLKCVA